MVEPSTPTMGASYSEPIEHSSQQCAKQNGNPKYSIFQHDRHVGKCENGKYIVYFVLVFMIESDNKCVHMDQVP